ncbi:hypothetical protein V1504DRAFT_453422 [Lipomyces starkeyi]
MSTVRIASRIQWYTSMDKTEQIYVQDGDRATRIAFDEPPTSMWRRLLQKIELKSAGKSNARR